ncbi:MAG: hypothetical protein R3301_19325, partial [Saprospiraceae bacterium]|nr:hypothetical protein [Saprospiraceae bacterium]
MKQALSLLALAVTIGSCQSPDPAPPPEKEQLEDVAANCAGIAENDSIDLYEIEPIALVPEALGTFGRVITTSSQEAQDFFNQGIQLKYAFAVNDAISSFREAQLRDPDCAMCYWGEAWALGSYLNGHMRESKAPLALA